MSSIDLQDTDPALKQLGIGISAGVGAPSYVSQKGSLYVRFDATTASTRLYINTDGGTTWTGFTTAA